MASGAGIALGQSNGSPMNQSEGKETSNIDARSYSSDRAESFLAENRDDIRDTIPPSIPTSIDPPPLAADQKSLEASLPKIISFSSLVRCGDEVWIEHQGSIYRLRRTKQDKLILTK